MLNHQDRLIVLFQYYCSFGEPLNNTKLKSSKFVKLLKDAGLVNNLQGGTGMKSYRGERSARNNENVNSNIGYFSNESDNEHDEDLLRGRFAKGIT